MQSKKVFRVLLFGLAGTLLASHVCAQPRLTCPVAAQLFYQVFGYRPVMGNAVFEVLEATCADMSTEGKAGKAVLALETQIVRTEGAMPLTSAWDPFTNGYVPVGSKFKIFVEARYTLWGLDHGIGHFRGSRGGLRGAGGNSTDSKIDANIDRGF